MGPILSATLGEVAWMVTAMGGVGLTVTTVEALAEPPGPLALIVYVVELVGWSTVEPCRGTEPTVGEMLSWVALVELQVKVVELPSTIVDGVAWRETVGRGGGDAAPPPQAISPTTRKARKRAKQAAETDTVGAERIVRNTQSRSRKVRKTVRSSRKREAILGRHAAVGGRPRNAAGLELTLIVSVLVSVPLAGRVPDAGLKVQDSPAGRPAQPKVNWSARPFCEVTETLKFAEEPTEICAETGETAATAF